MSAGDLAETPVGPEPHVKAEPRDADLAEVEPRVKAEPRVKVEPPVSAAAAAAAHVRSSAGGGLRLSADVFGNPRFQSPIVPAPAAPAAPAAAVHAAIAEEEDRLLNASRAAAALKRPAAAEEPDEPDGPPLKRPAAAPRMHLRAKPAAATCMPKPAAAGSLAPALPPGWKTTAGGKPWGCSRCRYKHHGCTQCWKETFSGKRGPTGEH